MHILDFIMYFVTAGILMFLVDKLSGGEFTNELGGLIGLFILIVFTIVYIILFCFYPDWNWVDIFNGNIHIPISW